MTRKMEHSRARIIIDGAIAGIIGAVVVAIWFLIFDMIRGHALETPALLAATILHGSHSHEVHHGLALLALEYSLIHFGAFITESSGHLSEYVPYYRKRPDLIKERRARKRNATPRPSGSRSI